MHKVTSRFSPRAPYINTLYAAETWAAHMREQG